MPPIFRPHERGPPGNRGARIYTWQVGRAYPWSRGNLYISSDVRKNNVCTKGFWTLYLHTLEMGHNGSKSRPESVALEFCPRERETNRSENIPSQSRQKLKACPCHPFLTCSIWKMRRRSYQRKTKTICFGPRKWPDRFSSSSPTRW